MWRWILNENEPFSEKSLSIGKVSFCLFTVICKTCMFSILENFFYKLGSFGHSKTVSAMCHFFADCGKTLRRQFGDPAIILLCEAGILRSPRSL